MISMFDLVIVGGGLVGAGLARALRDSDLKIALVDAREPTNDDPRLFALNESSCQFLKNLTIWPALRAYAAPIHQVQVSWEKHFGAVRLDRNDVDLDALGHVIPANKIEFALNEALSTLSNVTLYRPAVLKKITQEKGLARLVLQKASQEIEITTPLVIGADGTESTVRAQANIEVSRVNYSQSALVTRTILRRPHQHIAYERFTQSGAIAMLPLTSPEKKDGECATIWTADNERIAYLQALSEQAFLEELQTAFGYRLGRLEKISKRHVFPLQEVKAKKAIEKSIFLLGNAAHTMSPIAAQGFNLAIYEVAVLVENLLNKKHSLSPLTAETLKEVQDKTYHQASISMGLSHHLSNLFSSPFPLQNMILPVGMMGLDRVSPLKKHFIKRLIGRAGRVPKLLLSMEV